MSQQIAGGIHLVGGAEISHPADCMVYALDLGVTVMIDCGTGLGWSRIQDNMARVNMFADNLSLLILTHCHVDHAGGAPLVKEETGCRVICHELDREALESGDQKKTAASMYGMQLQPMVVDDPMHERTVRLGLPHGTLHLLHTPGHTPGSLSVWLDTPDAGRILFGQDIHGPFDPSFGSDVTQWRRSMNRLLSLKADILCEGHYGVIMGASRVEAFIRNFLSQV